MLAVYIVMVQFHFYFFLIKMFRLKDLSIDEMVGAWYFGCCLVFVMLSCLFIAPCGQLKGKG